MLTDVPKPADGQAQDQVASSAPTSPLPLGQWSAEEKDKLDRTIARYKEDEKAIADLEAAATLAFARHGRAAREYKEKLSTEEYETEFLARIGKSRSQADRYLVAATFLDWIADAAKARGYEEVPEVQASLRTMGAIMSPALRWEVKDKIRDRLLDRKQPIPSNDELRDLLDCETTVVPFDSLEEPGDLQATEEDRQDPAGQGRKRTTARHKRKEQTAKEKKAAKANRELTKASIVVGILTFDPESRHEVAEEITKYLQADGDAYDLVIAIRDALQNDETGDDDNAHLLQFERGYMT
jgi:hypothetical protein